MQEQLTPSMAPATDTYDLLLRHATLIDGVSTDIGVRADTIVAIGPELASSAARILELDGQIVLPGFVDVHTHLDKALTVTQALNRSGTLYEALGLIHTLQLQFTRASVYERALRMARMFLASGVTALRTHVDVTEATNLVGVEALLDVRDAMRGLLDIQLVTLNCALAGAANARNREMIEEALRMGVDVVGGCPVLDSDFRAHIDVVFALAQRFGRPIDMHIDESDDPTHFCLPYLAEKTIAEGYQGQVTAGHCCALAAVDAARARRAIAAVREAGITVVTLPSANMYLQGRGDEGCVRRGITRVRDLLAGGVPVCCGSDNVQDPFNPFGRGDLLLVANLLAHAAHLGSPAEQRTVLEAITSTPARTMNLQRYGLQPGCAADLVVLDSREPHTLLATVPPRRYVLKAGRVVAETRTEAWLESRAPAVIG